MANYKSSTEKGKCIFCEIAKGNIAPMGEGTIYEDNDYLAWLSPFPNTEGFTIVIPRKHYPSDVLAMSDEALHKFILIAKKVSNILLRYFEDAGRVGLIMEGTGIDHAHIKLIPMHGTGYMKQGIWKQQLSGKSAYSDKYEGYLVSADGPKADFNKLKNLAEKIRKSS